VSHRPWFVQCRDASLAPLKLAVADESRCPVGCGALRALCAAPAPRGVVGGSWATRRGRLGARGSAKGGEELCAASGQAAEPAIGSELDPAAGRGDGGLSAVAVADRARTSSYYIVPASYMYELPKKHLLVQAAVDTPYLARYSYTQHCALCTSAAAAAAAACGAVPAVLLGF
jgi:hypothetical protein